MVACFFSLFYLALDFSGSSARVRILVFHGFSCRYKNQNVAIKIVHKGDTPEEAAKREARFAREVSMMARVQHKNLVKVSIFE